MNAVADLLPLEAKRHGPDIFILSRPFDSGDGEVSRFRLATIHCRPNARRGNEAFAQMMVAAVNAQPQLLQDLETLLHVVDINAASSPLRYASAITLIRERFDAIKATAPVAIASEPAAVPTGETS